MKNFRRTFNILVALVLCITVSGVYANWMYASQSEMSESVNKGVSLTPKTVNGSLGHYTVLLSEVTLAIDQTDAGDYTPKLVFSKVQDDGSIDFTFTPEIVASDDLKANGVTSYVTFSSSLSHENTTIFTFPQVLTIGQIGSGEQYCWEKDGDSFRFSLPNEALGNYIKLAYTNKLDTLAKYTAFEESLKAGTVVITISNTAPTE